MTNYEKYKDDLIKMPISGFSFAVKKDTNELCKCVDIVCCSECIFDNIECSDKKLEWLDKEYKEPTKTKEKEIDWEKVPKDTLLLVRNENDDTITKEYYAGFRTRLGRIATYSGGRTSKTTNSIFNYWDEAKIVDKE